MARDYKYKIYTSWKRYSATNFVNVDLAGCENSETWSECFAALLMGDDDAVEAGTGASAAVGDPTPKDAMMCVIILWLVILVGLRLLGADFMQ